MKPFPASAMRTRMIAAIQRLPRGKVSTYGGIAKAAGYPGYARQVAQVLHRTAGLPWHRVIGAGGAIKAPGEYANEQRFRLRVEGVVFRGKRVDMGRCGAVLTEVPGKTYGSPAAAAPNRQVPKRRSRSKAADRSVRAT